MTDTLSLIELLEARKAQLLEISECNADALGRVAGFGEAIAIVRQHQAEQPQDVVRRVTEAIEGVTPDGVSSLSELQAKAAITAMGEPSCPNDAEARGAQGVQSPSPTILPLECLPDCSLPKGHTGDCQSEMRVVDLDGLENALADVLGDDTNWTDGNTYNRATMKPASMRFAIMRVIRPYLRAMEPVSVSLKTAQFNINEAFGSLSGHMTNEEIVQEVLDAAGVKYVD